MCLLPTNAAAKLDEIQSWYLPLAQEIRRGNPDLTGRQLSAAVRRVMVYIVFLRLCRARGIELPDRGLPLLDTDTTDSAL